jgi:hypothetical protein
MVGRAPIVGREIERDGKTPTIKTPTIKTPTIKTPTTLHREREGLRTMPLPPPSAERRHIHTRRIVCEAFERSDGLWEVDANMVDTKTHDTERGRAGQPLHDMWVRLTLDTDFVIRDVASAMNAYPNATCPMAVDPMRGLIGVRIGAGWQQDVRKHIGGALGCTHLRELLAPMATTAMQAMGHVLRSRGTGRPRQGKGTCYAKSDDADRALYRDRLPARAPAEGRDR